MLDIMNIFGNIGKDTKTPSATLVYHGGRVEVKNPEIRIGKYYKDFGYEFYITKLQKQAEKWSSRYNNGVVSVYDYNIITDLKILTFDKMTDEWLDFVVSCRIGKSHNYDIVEGPMADDKVYDYVADYINGDVSREAFWALVRFKYPTHQIALCTDRALDTVKFKYSYGVKRNETF